MGKAFPGIGSEILCIHLKFAAISYKQQGKSFSRKGKGE
jgi:hypothetical protein